MTGVDAPVARRLFGEAFVFDFFQAVRLMEKVYPARKPVGVDAAPPEEVLRFRAHLSLAFPPSQVFRLDAPDEDRTLPEMIVTFMGLTGPSGVLPTHYTQMLLDIHRDIRGPERRSLRDFFDVFNHRFISLFYRAWRKYRFWLAYEGGEAFLGGPRQEPDAFTRAVYCLLGLGEPTVRGRMRVVAPREPEKPVARIDDLALLHYAGILAQRPRNSTNLRSLVEDYFEVPVLVKQFRGQWLKLERSEQTCLGSHGSLGVDAVAGSRVWEVQSKFRLRIGPLSYAQFEDFLPDRSVTAKRKALFLMSHLVRYFVGPALDFDVQLVLKAREVPACRIGEGPGLGARLGWNTWMISAPPSKDADEAVFEGEEVVRLGS